MKKLNNLHRILNYIIISNGVSRAEISRKLGLNKATVSYLIAELENANLIKQRDVLKVTKGRYSVLYDFNKDYGTIININVSHNQLKYYVTKLNGEIILDGAEKIKIKDKATLVTTLKDVITNLLKNHTKNFGIGIGILGTVYNNEIIHFMPYNDLYEFDLKAELKELFPANKIVIENEANITALGESNSLNEKNVVTITNSKGIGSGIITNYNIYKGYNGFAGEIGHTIVVPDGLECACGNKGCLEQYSSEENIYTKASLLKNKKISGTDFLELFNNNDEEIRKIYYDSLTYLSIAINNTISLLNPSSIILSGFLYTNIKETLPYVKSKLNSKMQDKNIYVISTSFDKAFCIGFSDKIVKEVFVESSNWLETL